MNDSLFADSREVHTNVDTTPAPRKVYACIDLSEWPMPVEYDHDRRCYAASVIAVVENFRDDENMSIHEVRVKMQDGSVHREACGYLVDGIMPCACEVTCVNGLPPWWCHPANECRACINTTFVESHREYREAPDFVGTTPYLPFSPAEVIEEIAHYLRGNQL